ncbi:MAG: alpha/beta fold hydrolase [Leptospiraceae bacterium]|nr:alpha/beta fold hydrolase [Leptospiraceae bacterium]
MLDSLKRRKNPLFILSSITLIVVAAFAAGGAAIVFAIILVLLVLFYPFFRNVWNYFYGAEDISDQRFYAHTEDGWNIAMHFHRPTYPRRGAYPVILSHGIAVNKFGVDIDRDHSLAYFLAQNGFPVFVLSLRGVSKSYHSSRYRYQHFDFDDIVEYDVPAVIQKARQLTGAPKVNWVGHSMGSMIAMGYMGRKLPGHNDIASFVSIAGPGKLDHARQTLWGIFTRYPWINELIDFRFSAQVISPLAGRMNTPIEDVVLNPENVNERTVRKLMKNAIENISRGLARQFVQWMETGKETTRDGQTNYRSCLKNIKVPSLFIAGSRDHVAVPESVRFAYDQAGSKKKEFILLGPEAGAHVDYCHTGLVLGDHAIDDVYPRVLEWFETYGMEKDSRGFVARMFHRIRRRRRRRELAGDVRRRRRHQGLPPGVIRA